MPPTCARPRFSIVIPTCDRPDTLVSALASVLHQDYPAFEVVVADNHSGPATADAVAAFADRRIRYVRAPKRLSMADNWQLGLDHATGEYVTFLGDDDALAVGALQRAATLLADHDTKVLVWNRARYWWPEAGEPWKRHFLVYDTWCDETWEVAPQEVLERFYAFNALDDELPTVGNAFVHRHLIAAASLMTGRYFNDMLPEFASGIVNALYADRLLRTDRPLSIAGTSRHSLGAALWHGGGEPGTGEAFLREYADSPVLRLQLSPVVPDLNLRHGLLANAMVNVLHIHCGDQPPVRMDMARLIRHLLQRAQDHPGAYDDALATARFLARRYGAPQLLNPIPAKPGQPLPFSEGQLGDTVYVDTRRADVRDTFGASKLLAERTAPATEPPATPTSKWLAPLMNFSGYAALARSTILALDDHGLPISVRNMAQDRRFVQQLMAEDPDLLQRWRQLLQPVEELDALVIFHPPADHAGGDLYARFRQRWPNHRRGIGITMFETDRLPPGWAEACNRLDEVWVPSTFNRETFTRSGVPPAKVQVIPFGLDTARFQTGVTPLPIAGKKGFTFLSVFQWTNRKGWDVLLKAYLQAFRPDDDVCLVIRSYPDRQKTPPIPQRIEAYVRQLGYDPARIPAIVFLDQFVPDQDMPALYAAADAFVLPTRGEGWGVPFMEAMAMGKPVIATRWSAHLDFMNDANSYLIDIDGLCPVDAGQTAENPYYTRDHLWAEPSAAHTATLMRQVFEDRDEARRRGEQARHDIHTHWTMGRTAAWVRQRLQALI